jgi:hypothetical protein
MRKVTSKVLLVEESTGYGQTVFQGLTLGPLWVNVIAQKPTSRNPELMFVRGRSPITYQLSQEQLRTS